MSLLLPQYCPNRNSSRSDSPRSELLALAAVSFARRVYRKLGGGIILCLLISAIVTLPAFEQAIAYPWFLAKYGRGPSKDALQVQIGMTTEEVYRIAGRPHEKLEYADGEAVWVYHFDWQENSYRDIIFDSRGRVRATMTED